MKKLIIALGCITALGCEVDPVSVHKAVDNPTVTVTVVATFDGVRLYRVDTGNLSDVYVAVRTNGIDTNWNEQYGKIVVPRTTLGVQ